jgi:hypothetical protein
MSILREVRVPYLNAAGLPASTSIAVTAFARSGALLEVEAVAVLPLKAAKAGRAASKRVKTRARRRK